MNEKYRRQFKFIFWKILSNSTPWLEISVVTVHYLWLAFFHIEHSIHPFSPSKNLQTQKNMRESPPFWNKQKLHQKYSRNQHLQQFMRTASFTCMKLSILMILWHHTSNNVDTESNNKLIEVHGINSAQGLKSPFLANTFQHCSDVLLVFPSCFFLLFLFLTITYKIKPGGFRHMLQEKSAVDWSKPISIPSQTLPWLSIPCAPETTPNNWVSDYLGGERIFQ